MPAHERAAAATRLPLCDAGRCRHRPGLPLSGRCGPAWARVRWAHARHWGRARPPRHVAAGHPPAFLGGAPWPHPAQNCAVPNDGRCQKETSHAGPIPSRAGCSRRASTASPGGSGVPTSASGSGAPCARTTATTATPGTTSPHDHARSRAYRWGEDGLAGICDDQQRLCFALALWNGRDPILKERLFGLTNSEGNHGEDVKEYYFYLDSTPTHSYMKYPLQVPPGGLSRTTISSTTNRRADADRLRVRAARHRRLRRRPLLRRVRRVRQGGARGHPDPDHRLQPRAGGGELHVLPTLWFRNTWSLVRRRAEARPASWSAAGPARRHAPSHAAPSGRSGTYYLYCDGDVPLLFTENETNNERLFGSAEREPVRQGRDQRLRRRRPARRRESRTGRAPRPPRTTSSTSSPAQRGRSGCG